jgi:hypothetical protein
MNVQSSILKADQGVFLRSRNRNAGQGSLLRLATPREGSCFRSFGVCIVHSNTLFAEYLGLDYSVALELHLYHYVFRDLVHWAIANGRRWFQSTRLNYDPKLHLRHHLKPVDLCVRHTSTILNMFLRMALPLLAANASRRDVEEVSQLPRSVGLGFRGRAITATSALQLHDGD